MGAARRPATYEDLRKVPDNMVAEILDGELIVSPRPAARHSRAATILGGELSGPFDRRQGDARGPGGWWILAEPELHLGPDVIVPDLAGWRRARMPAIPDVPAFTLAPDWVCEVISPSTGAVDRGRKMRTYARERVAHFWIVDPLPRTVEVYRLEGERWVVAATYAGDDGARLEPFDSVEIDLARCWLEETPAAPQP